MIHKENYDFISQVVPFWENLSAAEKNQFISHASLRHYLKGDAIHTADFECIGLLLVKNGALRVYMLSEQGKEITLYRMGAGEICILSAACVLQMITFDVCIDAVADCQVLQVPSSVFAQLMNQNIYVENYAYKLAAERFSDVMWAMQQILFMSFDQRLAAFLLDETSALGTDTLFMTHEEIAKMMGSAREVVTRMLKYFSSEGWIRLSRGTVTIIDRKSLLGLL